jgi:predicted negative regulator of RcsB-dependent stress response
VIAMIDLDSDAGPGAGAASGAGDAAARFDRATELVGTGEHGAAAEALEAIADDFPGSSQAPEALFLAATLREEHLDEPAKATALYRRIGERYKDSRVALASARRLEALAPLLEDRPEAFTAFVSLKRRLPELGPMRALAEGDALLARHPDWSGADLVRLWMAGVAERSGDPARAGRLYQAVLDATRDNDVRFEAGIRAASLAISRGAYDRAEAVLDALPPGDNPGRIESARSARERLSAARTRAGVNVAAIIALVLGPLLLLGSLRHAAGSVRQAARALARPPAEAIYLAPLAVLFAIAATTGHHEVARAVITIAAVGVAVAWLSGAGLRVAAPTRWRPLAHAAIAGVTILAACYAAVHAGDLVDLLISTVRFGPDV